MRKRIRNLLFWINFALVTLVTTQRVEATLGESVDSVAADSKAFSAVQHAAVTRNGYTIHALTSDANVVREYISSSGVVFGVAWNGLSHPDLTSLLGSYVSEYHQALQQSSNRRGQRHTQVKANRVFVEKWGHMRTLQGRAYIPALIPPGVTIDEIK